MPSSFPSNRTPAPMLLGTNPPQLKIPGAPALEAQPADAPQLKLLTNAPPRTNK